MKSQRPKTAAELVAVDFLSVAEKLEAVLSHRPFGPREALRLKCQSCLHRGERGPGPEAPTSGDGTQADRGSERARGAGVGDSSAQASQSSGVGYALVIDSRQPTMDSCPIGEPAAEVAAFAAYHPAETILPTAEALAHEVGIEPARVLTWTAIWCVHQAAQAWRDDQEELDDLITSATIDSLLKT